MIQIVILAAGRGSRMHSDFPKVLQKIENRPMVDYLVTTIEESNFKIKPIAVVGYKAELVKKCLKNRVEYALQVEQLGTGHALACAKDLVANNIEQVIVLNGDMPFIKAETISKLVKEHKDKQAVLSVMSVRVPDFNDWRQTFYHLGRIKRNKNGLVEKIVEFKDASEQEKEIKEINTAFFCFDSKWLWENIKNLNQNNKAGEFYITDLVEIAQKQGKPIATIIIDDVRQGIGINTLEHLEIARGGV